MADAARRIPPGCALALALAALVLAIYAQAGAFPFISYDDERYIVGNPSLRGGLSIASLRWAATTWQDIGWLPLTWLSHLLDVSLFGMDAGKHHLVNVLFHLLNTLLLFGALRRMTGRMWESGLAAALFAVHPLRVESVAWVSERKDVLCAFFWMLSMGAYARYAMRPGPGRYGAVVLFFALGLMSKPMAVTLPFVLLLLDFWPLGRLRGPGDPRGDGAAPFAAAAPARLIVEKVPLFCLSAAVCAVTFLTQKSWGAVIPLDWIPLWARAANALDAYAFYLRKTVWPSGLALFYPHPGTSLPAWRAAAAGLFLVLATAFCLRQARRRPWLAAGWLWYLGTLVPVIGLVQVGGQAMADRYSYLPLVGLFVAAAWGAQELRGRLRVPGPAAAAVAGGCLAILAACAWSQAGYWRGNEPLFRRALETTRGNWLAHSLLGDSLQREGRDAEAAAHYLESIRIRPGLPEVHGALGAALDRMGRTDEAVASLREELRIQPESASARYTLGVIRDRQGRTEDAVAELREALRIRPDHAEANFLLGVIRDRQGRPAEAAEHYRRTLRSRPDHPEAHNNLGVHLSDAGRDEEAVAHFRDALAQRPGYAEAHQNLGMALWRLGAEREGIDHLRQAVRLRPGYVEAHNNLGVLLARSGAVDEAASEFREALRLDPGHRGARRNLETALSVPGTSGSREALSPRRTHSGVENQ